MSEQEAGYRSVMKALFITILVVIGLPWITLVVLEWLFSPRTGDWGNWVHWVGGGWALLVVAYITFALVRWRHK